MGSSSCRAQYRLVMPHVTNLKVRFAELDPYAHVNHAAYVSYFEVARTEALEDCGRALEDVAAEGIQFVVTEIQVKFKKPAVQGDVLEIDTWISEIGRASTRWSQRIRRGDELLVTEDLRVAIANSQGRPTKPPSWLFEGLTGALMEPPA